MRSFPEGGKLKKRLRIHSKRVKYRETIKQISGNVCGEKKKETMNVKSHRMQEQSHPLGIPTGA